jgi:aconitate hydratase 2/2-methylisocitrate dehydratase
MLEEYRKHVDERAAKGLVPEPLDAEQVKALVALLTEPPAVEEEFLFDLITNRVPPGVDEAALVKAAFLEALAKGQRKSPLIDAKKAVDLLGTMLGGYNIRPLIELLEDQDLAPAAVEALSNTLLVFDAFSDVLEKSKTNQHAKQVLDSWANAGWFTCKPELPEKITLVAFKVNGEINTDDLSPASEAWSRPDIPLHATAMLKNRMENPLENLNALKNKGYPLVFVGDVVGTGSSRKSAANSVLWHIGEDIPCVPNKRRGGFVLGGKIAPIFFNTMEDAGALPIECDVSKIKNGDLLTIFPYKGRIINQETGDVVSEFKLKTGVLLDEVRAGGRIPLIIGRTLTDKARKALGLKPSEVFRRPLAQKESGKGFTLAQKIVGRACGIKGARPGSYNEPAMASVGSQDTTGPMTRDELKELACLRFSAGLVMQSFCHTAAYPTKVDIEMHRTLPGVFTSRGGVALRPGDGIIHSWLNRMLLPDTVGTGGDSHTRFPVGISFPAGSGLVAFAAAMGVMPLDMPESVLVRFSGEIQPGITLRDLVNAIPYVAIEQGLLTVEKEGKKNIFSGRILEIEGLPDLKVDQAFELTDSSAERSAAASTILLNKESIVEYLKSNIALLGWLIKNGYQDAETLERRIKEMEDWVANPVLLKPDTDADYAAVVEIDLNQIKEPILACPNDPDDVRLLSEVAGNKVDEVFIGSCMTNIGHFRAAGKLLEGKSDLPVRLWIAPPTKMDAEQLKKEGYYGILGRAGARIEVPGCSLCMGNQARAAKNAVLVSTSTRNFPNRIGDGADVYLGSAELAAVCSVLGRIPTVKEYFECMKEIEPVADDVYRYMNFNESGLE